MNPFERCLNVLRDAAVEFVIIGGVASSAHGSPSVTYDLDVCYRRSPANLQRLAEALAPFHPKLRGVSENVPFHLDVPTLKQGLNFTLTTDLGDMDLFGEVVGIGNYADVQALSAPIELFGRPCLVLSLEGLIRSKRASGRDKDLLVLPELEALREVLSQDKDLPDSRRSQSQGKKGSKRKR